MSEEEKKQRTYENWKRYYYRNPEAMKARRVASQKSNCEFIDSFKTACVRCGNADKRVLDFHHIDDSTKLFEVASRRVAGYAKNKIKAEIDKCEILCANCHRIHHWEEINENKLHRPVEALGERGETEESVSGL